MDKYIKEILDFDKKYGISKDNKPTFQNLFYSGLCIGGEAGELVNVIKKIWRDGDSIELRKQLSEELVDVVVYICKLIVIGEIDFDKAWKQKLEILHERWSKKLITERQVKI